MKFKVMYKVGKSVRETNIIAEDLDKAEKICNTKYKNWVDIIIINFKVEKI